MVSDSDAKRTATFSVDLPPINLCRSPVESSMAPECLGHNVVMYFLESDWSDAGGLTIEENSSLLQCFVSSVTSIRSSTVHKLTIATLADGTRQNKSLASYCEPSFSIV